MHSLRIEAQEERALASQPKRRIELPNALLGERKRSSEARTRTRESPSKSLWHRWSPLRDTFNQTLVSDQHTWPAHAANKSKSIEIPRDKPATQHVGVRVAPATRG